MLNDVLFFIEFLCVITMALCIIFLIILVIALMWFCIEKAYVYYKFKNKK